MKYFGADWHTTIKQIEKRKMKIKKTSKMELGRKRRFIYEAGETLMRACIKH
jgi:hypothetical protein